MFYGAHLGAGTVPRLTSCLTFHTLMTTRLPKN